MTCWGSKRGRNSVSEMLPDRIALLVEDAKSGNCQALEDLILEHRSFLSREIAKLCPQDALEDVAQEVLIRLYQGLPRYKESGSFRWWLKAIVSRTCLDYWRKVRSSQRIAAAYVHSNISLSCETNSDADITKDLHAFLSPLSAPDRIIFTLVFLEERTHMEVAELLGMSRAAIKVRCFRLKQKARGWFEL